MFGVILVLIFCCIRTKYGEIRSISPYSVRVREDMDQNNSEYGHFWRSEVYITTKMVKNMMKSMVVMSLVMMQGLKNSVEQLIDKLIFWKKNTLWNMNFSREMEVFQTNSVKSVPYSEFLWFVFSPFGLNTDQKNFSLFFWTLLTQCH